MNPLKETKEMRDDYWSKWPVNFQPLTTINFDKLLKEEVLWSAEKSSSEVHKFINLLNQARIDYQLEHLSSSKQSSHHPEMSTPQTQTHFERTIENNQLKCTCDVHIVSWCGDPCDYQPNSIRFPISRCPVHGYSRMRALQEKNLKQDSQTDIIKE
jgi:hypothetical protein